MFVANQLRKNIRICPSDLKRPSRPELSTKTSRPLLQTSGKDSVFQLHSELYGILARNVIVIEHYAHFKSDRVDKTYIHSDVFIFGDWEVYIEGRHASEFAHSVGNAVALYTERIMKLRRVENALCL